MKNVSINIKVSLHKPYSTDGIELDSLLFEPINPTNKIIIHIHGKEGHFIQNHFVTVMGNAYPRYDYAFLTFNNRGHDYMADLIKKTSTGYIWEKGGAMFDTIEESVFDLDGVIKYVSQLGYTDITLQGHSLGPHKICYYVSQVSTPKISRIILLSTSDILYLLNTQVPEWQKYSRVAKQMIDEGKSLDLMPIKLWSNCPVSAKTFWNFTKPDSECFVFNFSQPKMEFRNFNKVSLPILVINPEEDFSQKVSPLEINQMLKERTCSNHFQALIQLDTVHNFLGKEEDLVIKITNWLTHT